MNNSAIGPGENAGEHEISSAGNGGPAGAPVQLDPAEVRRRDYAAHLQAAIAALAAGARLRRPTVELSIGVDGQVEWRSHPSETAPCDWAEFVTLAVAGAAADAGGVEAALAGHPRSGEADNVRRMVASTLSGGLVGQSADGTESIFVRVPVASILEDLMDTSGLYDESHEILSAQLDEAQRAAEIELDQRPHVWQYRIERHQGVRTMVPLEDDAPAFDETRWREDLIARGTSAESLAALMGELDDPSSFIEVVAVTRNDASRLQVVELDARHAAIVGPHQRRLEALLDQRDSERTAYAYRLQVAIEAEAARRFPGIDVAVYLDHDFYGDPDDLDDRDEEEHDTPVAQLLHYARTHTPLPGSGMAPVDYPPSVPISHVEREAGRLPHKRM